MESDKQVAAKIVDDWFQIGVQDYPNGDCDYYITSKRWEKRSEEAKELKNHIASAIANALQAARTPPPGHIIDDAGVVRKVLGVLPVTADGCVAGHGAVVSFGDINYRMVMESQYETSTWNRNVCVAWGGPNHGAELLSDCHSVPESAEAAKEGKA